MMDGGGIKATLTVEGLRKFQSDMGAAGDSMDVAGKKGATAGAAIGRHAKAGFLAAGAAAVASVKKFADFDDAMNRVQINSGATSKQMQSLGKAARDMGKKFPASATEAAEAMNELLKAGMSVDDVLGGGLKQAMAMATAEGLDMAASADAMAKSMATFRVEAANANTVTAALSNVASNTSADMTDLMQSLGQAGGVASDMGWSIGETTAALGVLIQSGLDGSKAGTSLAAMLRALRAPTPKLAEDMERLGLSVYDASGNFKDAESIVGDLSAAIRGMTKEEASRFLRNLGVDAADSATFLARNAEQFRQLAKDVQNVDAPVQKATAQMQSLKMQLDTTGESIGNAAMQVGAALAPAVLAVLPHISSLADRIVDSSGDIAALGDALVAFGSGIGAVVVPAVQMAAGALALLGGAVGSTDGGLLRFAGTFAAVAVAARLLAPAMLAVRTSMAMAAEMTAVQAALSGSVGVMGSLAGASGVAAIGLRTMATAAKAAVASVLPLLAITAVASAMFTAGSQAQGLAANLGNARGAARDLKVALDELTGTTAGLEDAELGAREASNQLAQARDNARRAAKDGSLTEAQREAAVLSVERAELRAKEATKRLADERKKVADAADKAAKKDADLNREVERSAESAGKAGDEWQEAATKAALLGDAGAESSTGIRSSGDAADDAAGKVDGYAQSVNSLPASKTVAVRLESGGFASGISLIRNALASIPSSKTVTVKRNGFASGGRVYGAGTGTSDSVPAMLSAGEWVLTAAQARGIGYDNLASLPKFAQGGAWFTSQASAASASMGSGSAYWRAMEFAGATDDLGDDRAAMAAKVADLRDRLNRIRNESPKGDGAGAAKSSAVSEVQGAIRELSARIWQIDNITGPAQAAARQKEIDDARAAAASADASARVESRKRERERDEARRQQHEQHDAEEMRNAEAARAAAVSSIGAKGSDLWKQSSLAAATESLDDDRAALVAKLSALQALGTPEAQGAINDTLADIWTLENITMPAQAAQAAAQAAALQAQKDQWTADAAAAMGRGFYSASGGAGGGGEVGTVESTGGGASGVGHAPRPEVDRIWLDGVQLNDLDARTGAGGVEITEILGWDEAEDFESVRSKRADGDSLGGNRDGSVQITVKGRVRGSSYSDYHARRRALKAKVRAATAEVLMKVPDVTAGSVAGDYASAYSATGMVGYERRSVKLTANLTWTDSFAQFGSGFEFTLRSPQRFVVDDVAAIAPASSNAAAMSTAAGGALTTILAVRGEIAASPALDTARKFVGVNQTARVAIRARPSVGEFDTFTKLPSALNVAPPSGGFAVAFDPTRTYMAVAGDTSPYVTIYKRSGDTFTKLTNPSTLPASVAQSVTFDPTGTYLVVGHVSSPYVTIYKRSGDTFTKLTNPASLPSGTVFGVSFSPDATYLAAAHTLGSRITLYKRSGDTFTKITDPDVVPASGDGRGVSFDPTGTYLSMAASVTPFVYVYKRSGDAFTKLADPATLPGSYSESATFDPTGTYLAVAHVSSPYVTIYKRSGDTFTKLTNPSTLPGSAAEGVSFDPTSSYLTVSHSSSPYVTIYKRSGDTFTKLTNPASLPAGYGYSVAFDPSGGYMAVGVGSSPYVEVYGVGGSGSYLDDALGTMTITPPTVAIASLGSSLPVASADFSASGNLSARDSFLVDTATRSATPLLRTPLARLLGGGSMLFAMLPTRSSKNDYTLLSVIGSTPRVADAILALNGGNGLSMSSTGAVNEAVGGALNYPGLMPLAGTDNTVTTALAGWRAKVSGADFSSNGYVLRRFDATLGAPSTRPVMHVALIAPPASWGTTQTALAAATGTKFATYLSTQQGNSGGVRNTSVGLYHDGTRMVPAVQHSIVNVSRIIRFSGAPAITPDPALHVFAAVIIDAGDIHHMAIAMLDVFTGIPLAWICHSMSVFGAASTEQTDASQAVTASGAPTLTSTSDGTDRNVGVGSTSANLQNTGLATSAAGHSGFVTLDAMTELAPYGVTLAGASNGLKSRTALASIARVVREWIGKRFAPQTLAGQPIALGVEWTDREPEAHAEPYVRLDSIIAEQYEQDLGRSRTGGLSTEHMSVAGARGVGATPLEARSVR